MALDIKTINIGTVANDGTGTPTRESWNRMNQNSELFGKVAVSSADSTADFLAEKLTAGTGITLTQNTTDPENYSLEASLADGAAIANIGYTPANETITITAGTGLTGGGSLSANQTISLDPVNARTALELGSAAYEDTTFFASAAQGTLADTAVQPGDLATVATTGSYNNLSDAPTLGTAAAEDVTDFAASTTQVIAGTGLTGGGALSTDVTLSLATGAAATNLGYTPANAATTVSAGTGLTGGGDLSINRTISLNAEIAQLTDVTITTPTNGQLLSYNSTTSVWENVDAYDGDDRALITTQVLAGTGLSGGGDLSTDRTISLDVTSTQTALGLGTAAYLDVGTSANKIVQLDSSARLPAIDGSQLTGLPSGANSLDGLSDVTITTPINSQVLTYNNSSSVWENTDLPTIIPTTRTVSAGTGLSGGGDLSTDRTISVDVSGMQTALGLDSAAYAATTDFATAAQGSLASTAIQPGDLAAVATTGLYTDLDSPPILGTAAALDVGTSDGNVVQIQTGGKLPALDGSDLTNLPSGSSTIGGLSDVTITTPTRGQVLTYNNSSSVWENTTPVPKYLCAQYHTGSVATGAYVTFSNTVFDNSPGNFMSGGSDYVLVTTDYTFARITLYVYIPGTTSTSKLECRVRNGILGADFTPPLIGHWSGSGEYGTICIPGLIIPITALTWIRAYNTGTSTISATWHLIVEIW